MKVLVTAASKHGATSEIALAIAAAIRDEGLDVTVLEPDAVESVERYDGVVIGSGVYAGHWLEPAKRLVGREAQALLARSVWLFSSGPLGVDAKPATVPVDVAPLSDKVRARGHRIFAGSLERDGLGLGERAIIRVVKAPYGDFRDWPGITSWAREIAAKLKTAPAAV